MVHRVLVQPEGSSLSLEANIKLIVVKQLIRKVL